MREGTSRKYNKDAFCDLDILKGAVIFARNFCPPRTWSCRPFDKDWYDKDIFSPTGQIKRIKGLKYEQDRLWEKLQKVRPLYKIVPNYRNIGIAVGILFLLTILLIIF